MDNNTFHKLARGSWQRDMLKAMLSTAGCHSPAYLLQGKAKLYLNRYNNSFQSILQRVRNAGYKINVTPGPRGGEYGSIYRINF